MIIVGRARERERPMGHNPGICYFRKISAWTTHCHLSRPIVTRAATTRSCKISNALQTPRILANFRALSGRTTLTTQWGCKTQLLKSKICLSRKPYWILTIFFWTTSRWIINQFSWLMGLAKKQTNISSWSSKEAAPPIWSALMICCFIQFPIRKTLRLGKTSNNILREHNWFRRRVWPWMNPSYLIATVIRSLKTFFWSSRP